MTASYKLTMLAQVFTTKVQELMAEHNTMEKAQALIAEYKEVTGSSTSFAPLMDAINWKARILAVRELNF